MSVTAPPNGHTASAQGEAIWPGVTDLCFRREWKRLVDNYLSAAAAETVTGKRQLYAELIQRNTWISDAVFTRVVTDTLETVKGRLPDVAEFRVLCGFAKEELERESRHVALPAPQRPETDEADPNDPYSSTPEERERWAREDAWIRGWRTTMAPLPSPEILARMAAKDREEVLDQRRRDESVAGWPDLTPAARRAKEARIALEREAAIAKLTKLFGRPPRLAGIPTTPQPIAWDLTRLAEAERKWYGGEAEVPASIGEWPE